MPNSTFSSRRSTPFADSRLSEASFMSQRGRESQLTARDWSLLLSPGRTDMIRRPWPEYEPESSAAVGRRWSGHNLGRLYEHKQPEHAPLQMSRSPSSLSMRSNEFA